MPTDAVLSRTVTLYVPIGYKRLEGFICAAEVFQGYLMASLIWWSQSLEKLLAEFDLQIAKSVFGFLIAIREFWVVLIVHIKK